MRHITAVIAAMTLAALSPLIASAAVPAAPADGYAAQPWPNVQNAEIAEAVTYIVSAGTLIMVRYNIGQDYQSTTTSDRVPVDDLDYASNRFQLVFYDISNSAQDVETGRRVIIGAKAVSDFVNSGYSTGFIAMFFADETYTETIVEIIGISDPLNLVTLASSTPSVSETRGIRSGDSVISSKARNILKSVQHGGSWTAADITLLSTDNILTHSGEAYMSNNAPYMRFIAPNLYEASLDYPPFHFEDRGGKGAQEEVDASLTGTSFQNSFRGLALWTGVPEKTVSSIVVILCGVGAAYYAMRLAQSALAVIPVFVIVLAGGVMMSWVPMALIASMGAVGAIILAFLLFIKRAS